MAQAASKKQYRMMMAILHGKSGKTSRGDSGPPKSVAGKYAGSKPSGAPESKGKEHEGGRWDAGHKEKDAKRVKQKRIDKRKKKAKLRKALEKYLEDRNVRGAGMIIVNSRGQILLGQRTDNMLWCTPGGHVEDGETFEEGALRELKEETGISAKNPQLIHSGMYRGIESRTFMSKDYSGRPKSNGEMVNLKFMSVYEIPWESLTDYCFDSLSIYISTLNRTKKLQDLLAKEDLQKNLERKDDHIIYEMTHGDALRLVGNGTFRMIRDAVKDMDDEDFRDIKVDNYTLSIRKHHNDVYSGRVVDGHKQIWQFANKSLPEVTAGLMSVFEWYLPEDEGELEIIDHLDDDVIEGGISELVDKYKQHNIVNIYTEMENIRQEVRNGMAVDLQQVEQRIMKLFDRMEESMMRHADKHNDLAQSAGSDLDELEGKLRALQTKIEELSSKPTKVEAYSSSPVSGSKVHDQSYPYLSRPNISIAPSGHISITFGSDWTQMEQSDFLKDMKAKVIKKARIDA